jgi:hypothetical protein
MNLFFDLFGSGKKKLSEKDLIQRVAEFNKELIIWGDKSMIKTWLDFQAASVTGDVEDPLFIADSIGNLLKKIRADLGHNDFLLAQDSLYGLIVNLEARVEIDSLRQNKNSTTDSPL